MDTTTNINRISAETFNIPKGPSAQQVVSNSPTKAGNLAKESGISQPVDNKTIQELMAKARERLDCKSISITFSTYGKKNEKISISVTEKETGKVIREIPPEELQRLSAKMEELMGVIFNDQV